MKINALTREVEVSREEVEKQAGNDGEHFSVQCSWDGADWLRAEPGDAQHCGVWVGIHGEAGPDSPDAEVWLLPDRARALAWELLRLANAAEK